MKRIRRIKVRSLMIHFKTQKEMYDFKVDLALKLNCKPDCITFTFDDINKNKIKPC